MGIGQRPREPRSRVSGVGIADDRDLDGGADVLPVREHLPVGDEPGIGKAELHGGDPEPAHEREREPRALDESCREGVVAAGKRENPWPAQELPERPRRAQLLVAFLGGAFFTYFSSQSFISQSVCITDSRPR